MTSKLFWTLTNAMTNGIATKLLSAILVRDLALCTSFICWLQKSKNFLMRLDCYLVPVSDGSGWNFKIFPSFRFYVNSILQNSAAPIPPFLQFKGFWIWLILHTEQKFKKSKFRASKWVEMADLAILESPKLISRKISVIEKLHMK